MKLFFLTFSVLCGPSIGWETDARCPAPRLLLELGSMTHLDTDILTLRSDSPEVPPSEGIRNLRGNDALTHRELQSSFQLKMFWKEGYCWQEEWIERKWCLTCDGNTCKKGEKLWIRFCARNQSNQRFIYIPVQGTGGGQLKTATENLCIERTGEISYLLAGCNSTNNDTQIFTGVRIDGSPFELSPKGQRSQCLTNNAHHPKAEEILYSTSCKVARSSHTNAWTTYHGGSESNPLSATEMSTLKTRLPVCSTSRPCTMCQGACNNDNQCQGNLKCMKRNGNETVPGCFGIEIDGQGYCYDTSSKNTTGGGSGSILGSTLKIVGCSKASPCGLCEGDCDNNDDCTGSLICMLKDSPGKVNGCNGFDSSKSDFCVVA